MASVFDRVRDKLLGPKLRTYGEAREELGGLPWRKFKDTARWFLPSHRNLPPPVPMGALSTHSGAIVIDSAAISLSRPAIPELLRKKAGWLVAGAAVLMVSTVAIRSSGGQTAAAPAAVIVASTPVVVAPAVVAPPAAAVPAPAAALPAVAQKPVAQKIHQPKMSSSVRLLLQGKSTRGVARPTKLKKMRRR